MQLDPKSQSLTGILVVTAIVIAWIGSLKFLSFIDIYQSIRVWILLAILGRTFIQTGLFIVAHDAIHGSVYSSNRKLNDVIGRSAVTLYALLDYQKLTVNHWQHHEYPWLAWYELRSVRQISSPHANPPPYRIHLRSSSVRSKY